MRTLEGLSVQISMDIFQKEELMDLPTNEVY